MVSMSHMAVVLLPAVAAAPVVVALALAAPSALVSSEPLDVDESDPHAARASDPSMTNAVAVVARRDVISRYPFMGRAVCAVRMRAFTVPHQEGLRHLAPGGWMRKPVTH